MMFSRNIHAPHPLWCIAALGAIHAVGGVAIAPTTAQWSALKHLGRRSTSQGLTSCFACFSRYNNASVQPDAQSCAVVENNYTSPSLLSPLYSGYMQVSGRCKPVVAGAHLVSSLSGRTCQSSQLGCLLDSDNPSDPAAFTNKTCFQGSISPYYVSLVSPPLLTNSDSSDLPGTRWIFAMQQIFKPYSISPEKRVHLFPLKIRGTIIKVDQSLQNSLALWVRF